MARLVFCEDQEQIRKLIALAMRVTTHTIEVTANGREGLAAIERTVPDLVVTDLRMPDMDGFALADALRARASLRHIPILFITASVQRGQIAELRARGAADHLEKPFSPVALREKIDELLSKPPGSTPSRPTHLVEPQQVVT